MNLSVDLGNTLFKVGLFDDDELTASLKVDNKEYSTLIKFIKENNFDLAIISSVVNVPLDLSKLLERKSRKVVKLDHKINLPFKSKYLSPDTLGNDRIALVAGALSVFGGKNILVIDAGSCVTYDFVDSEKFYYGGAISPGLMVRFKSLNHYTSNLPLLSFNENVESIIGNSTKNSIYAGVIFGLLFEIEGFIREYENKYEALKIIMSGGDGSYFAKKSKYGIFVEPNLVLKGLNQILLLNV